MKVLVNLNQYIIMPDGKQYNCIFGDLLEQTKKLIILGEENNFINLKKKDIISVHRTNYICMDEMLYRWNVQDMKVYEYESPTSIYFMDSQKTQLDNFINDLKKDIE